MARQPSKHSLRDELLAALEADLQAGEAAQRAAQEGATHEDARPENDKDTRATEQSYLARGQAVRVEALQTGLLEVRAMSIAPLLATSPIVLGALVTIDEEGKTQLLFLAPQGGGKVLAGGRVQVVTPASPLGRGLLGKRLDEDCEIAIGRRTRALTVTGIE